MPRADRPASSESRAKALARGQRAARFGIIASAGLAIFKLAAGIIGTSYALIADAIESSADIVSSAVVLGGLRVAGRDPDEQYPFGYGKAEALSGAIVALMLIVAAIVIAIAAVLEIQVPRHAPAWWTLVVLVVVVVVKTWLSHRVGRVATDIGSTAVRTDASHHMSDALTSAAAFVGILIAVVGGTGWESADDWAALAASAIIGVNGVILLRPAVADLMDRAPEPGVIESIRSVAVGVEGVRAIEKLAVRRVGLGYRVVVHVQADPGMPLRDAHALGGTVTRAMHRSIPEVDSVVVHMEPFESAT
jgi:cation diffusion facilitator family transporter